MDPIVSKKMLLCLYGSNISNFRVSIGFKFVVQNNDLHHLIFFSLHPTIHVNVLSILINLRPI